jgi:hypothetical protein
MPNYIVDSETFKPYQPYNFLVDNGSHWDLNPGRAALVRLLTTKLKASFSERG